MAAPAPRRSQAGPRVRPLAALGCPLGGLAPGRARVLGAGARVFASTGGRFVHVYDREGQRLSAAFEFPAPVRHLQLLPGPAALLVLGARSGLYRVSLEPASRSPGNDVACGDGVDCEPPLRRTPVGPDACILPDPSLCAFAVCGELLVTLALGSTRWKVRRTLCPAPGEEVPPAPIGEVDLPVKVPPAGSPTQPPAPQHLPVLCHVAPTGLDPTLPGLLFGTDACILRSPLLLCGLPGGQLCAVLLDALATSHGTPGDPHALVRTIHHLQEPVVFVGALSTGPPAEGLVDMPSNCLVALGCRGRLLTVRAGRDEAGSPVLELREHQVPGPVLCAACDRGRCLFLSTPSGLCVVGLSEQGDICPISTGLCRLAALAVSTIAPGESPELLALSARGRLLACDLGLISQSVPKGGTQHIPDLLAQITTTSEKVASLQNQAEQQNQALQSLNEALAVTRALLCGQKSLGPVSCCIYAAWTCLSSGDMLLACCKLSVQPGFNLGRGWALCVRLLPVTRADTDTPDTATTFTVPLGLLGPGAQHFVTLPLNCAEAGAPQLPVLVSCRLFYSLWDSVGNALDPRALPQNEAASLPLAWTELDLLHALRFPNSPGPTPCGVPRDPIDIFLEARCRSGSEQRVPLLPPTPTAVVVIVSVQLLRAALARHHSDLPLGPATLRWLLSGNLDAEKAPVLPHLHGVAPDGTDVHLSVREVCVSDASPDGPLQAVEIQVESPVLGVLSAAHRAIARRVQALTLEPTSSHAPDFCLHHLQVLQASREALLREVRALREQLRLGEEEAPHVARHLLHTFQNLRASGPPLL